MWDKVQFHLRRIASAFDSLTVDRGVNSTLAEILGHQGVKLAGTTDEAIDEAATLLVEAVEQAKALAARAGAAGGRTYRLAAEGSARLKKVTSPSRQCPWPPTRFSSPHLSAGGGRSSATAPGSQRWPLAPRRTRGRRAPARARTARRA